METDLLVRQFPLVAKLTELDKGIFGMIFKKYDTDNNGHLNKAEFREYFREIRGQYEWIPENDNYAFELIDSDHNKMVTYDEFLAFHATMYDIQKTQDVTKYYRMIFDVCDIGGKGYLVSKEMKKFMKYAGFKTGLFEDSLKKYDLNKDGKIDWEEICIVIEAHTIGTSALLIEYFQNHKNNF